MHGQAVRRGLRISSGKILKETRRPLLSHSISWLFENFSRQTIIELSKAYIFEAMEIGL